MKQMISARKLLRQYQSKIVVLVLLLVLVVAVAIPGYATGTWPWTNPPTVANLPQLKNLRQNGMRLPGWEVIRLQNNVQIGGHRWLVEEIKNHQTIAILLLLPQNSAKNQPQVEWLDIDGFHRWETDSHRSLRFTVKLASIPQQQPPTVDARFFRSWTPEQTFAVMQWYAWPNGGSPATSRWFWQDSIARLWNRRASWVAVSIIIPLQPGSDIKIVEPLLESLAQTVQTQLIAEVFMVK
jgi:cyanoexosortase B-associated protein